MARTFFVGGNFKMNGSAESIKKITEGLNSASLPKNVEVVIAPPFPYLGLTVSQLKAPVEVSAQNCYFKSSGAFTGEVSPDQIKDVGANWVILGHSERRTIFHETDEFVAEKVKFALSQGLKVILCIGETLFQRDKGETVLVCSTQLDAVFSLVSSPKDWENVVIAYEPVWAIGTGKTATPEIAQSVHKSIREHISKKLGSSVAESVRILYGGSVNGANAASFKDSVDIDGFLVGGASLKPEFINIIKSRE